MVSILIPLYGQLLQVIGYIETGTDIKYDKKEEVVNMCKAWDEIIKNVAFRREYNKEYNREYSKECNKEDALKYIHLFRMVY